MPTSPPATEEQARLEALEFFSIVDTEKERTFDMITEMLAQMLGVPHACVSLVDRERVWFKSIVGIDADEVPREPGFCSTLVESSETVRYIEDARTNPETRNNSLVIGGPEIRFYAGAPLCTEDGHRIGTLCAFGPEPRAFGEIESASLVNLATLVMHEIDSRRVRNELQRTEEVLAASQRLDSLGLVASGVAHDFNNLLCAILGNTELLREELVGVERVHDLLQEIEDTGKRATELASQVLAYAGGDGEPIATLDLNGIVSDSYRMARSAFESQVRIELELGQGLLPVRGQATALRQVVVNLLTNAVQACDRAGGEVRVRTCPIDETEEVLLSVTDSGPGLSDAVKRKAFEPFFSSKPNGRGLGLPICKRIVEQHAGSIDIEPGKGSGTTALVRLPRSSAPLEPGGAPTTGSLISGRGESILVVDDDPAIRSMVQAHLERAGYAVVAAAGGQEAIHLLQEHFAEFRAVVLDWSMPLVNGERVLDRMSELDIHLPVILSSGHPEHQTSQGGRNREMPVTFLKKPFARADLLKRVNTALGEREG